MFAGTCPTTNSKVHFQKKYLPYPSYKSCEHDRLLSLLRSIKPSKKTYIYIYIHIDSTWTEYLELVELVWVDALKII